MNGLAFAAITFGLVLVATLLGLLLRRRLPEAHLSENSRDSLKLAIGLIASLLSLVLGLVISSSKNSFDLKGEELEEISANVVLLDRTLVAYGPEAQHARTLLRNLLAAGLQRVWGTNVAQPSALTVNDEFHALGIAVRTLRPADDSQRGLQAEAARLLSALDRLRIVLRQQAVETSVPTGFLIVIGAWLGIVFAGFGLLTAPNPTNVAGLVLGAACAAGALFLVLELDDPYGGLIRLSDTPLRNALQQIDR